MSASLSLIRQSTSSTSAHISDVCPRLRDRITSHDKKRSYLECLEEYVQWLHEEVRRAGETPVPLERISKYDGLSNRSLRVSGQCFLFSFLTNAAEMLQQTMLVHKQAETREANSRKVHAEARVRIYHCHRILPLNLPRSHSSVSYKVQYSFAKP